MLQMKLRVLSSVISLPWAIKNKMPRKTNNIKAVLSPIPGMLFNKVSDSWYSFFTLSFKAFSRTSISFLSFFKLLFKELGFILKYD